MGHPVPQQSSPRVEICQYLASDSWALPCCKEEQRRVRAAARLPGVVYTVFVDGKANSVFGVAGDSRDRGNLWYHETDGRDRTTAPLAFLRASRRIVRQMTGVYTALYGHLESPSDGLLRWLEFLGADLRQDGDTVHFTIQP
jgi:hypothetical protein